jgi:integration host factor subunit alpha
MTLTKNDLVESVQQNVQLPNSLATSVVESLLEIMKKTLENGERILISGFGNFSVNNKNERLVRNPKTGERLMMGSRRVVKFTYSQKLKNRVNQQ